MKEKKIKKWKLRTKPRGDKDASCPYCGVIIVRPHDTEITAESGFFGGECSCGAIFVYDETGGHGGEAIVEVMTAGCGGDWDVAWSLEPDVDYKQITVSYDERAHRISEPGDQYQPAGQLYFFKRLSK